MSAHLSSHRSAQSTENPPAALVGRGLTADVYAWGPGRVLKLFHPGRDAERAGREFRATRVVHAAGLPVPAACEVIVVGGRCGIVFERIDGPSLLDYVQARPWALPWSVRLLAELHARIHQCPAPADLPAHRAWIADRIAIAPLTATVRDAAGRRLATLPDGATICHGDFHPGNILITRRGPVVIDWGRAARGHPLGDVACTAGLMRTAGLPPWAPTFMHLTLRATRPVLYRKYLAGYLKRAGGTRAEVERWLGPLAAAVPAAGWLPHLGQVGGPKPRRPKRSEAAARPAEPRPRCASASAATAGSRGRCGCQGVPGQDTSARTGRCGEPRSGPTQQASARPPPPTRMWSIRTRVHRLRNV